MPVDPRTPVVVGRAQIVGPTPDVDAPTDAVSLMRQATEVALADAGAHGTDVDTVGVVGGLFGDPNPAATIAAEIGAARAHTILTTWGGNTPVALLGELGQRIVDGHVDLAVFVGGEANHTRDALRRAGREIPKREPIDTPAPEVWGKQLQMGNAETVERGGEMPRNTYAVFQSALRAAAGTSLDEARDSIAALWAGYSDVAAANPDLNVKAMDAEAIRNPFPSNRMVSWPYTKAMCANNRVDHAAALVVCSAGTADKLGFPRDQQVYLHETIIATDTNTFIDRERIDIIPGIDAAAVALTERWGPLDRFGHVDLYGCFPSIVQYTANALGLRPGRPLTVTGGLGFMGAPLNFAAGQSLVAMVRALRADPGSYGLVQGNGGHAAKHAFAVLSTDPPEVLPTVTTLDLDKPLVPIAPPDASGNATIEGLTVEFDHAGPSRAVAVCRLHSGEGRLWVTSTDATVMDAAITRELVGAPAVIAAGEFRF
ncbi:MAG: hypothetical protein P8I99_07355 [Acidimicrobiales bacterium]|nr:hypothetical protein [Acidimicrobiales bacterium]